MSRRPISLGSNQGSGSSKEGEPVFLVVGKLHRPHGVRGEIRMSVWTDFPERLQRDVVVYVGSEHQPLSLQTVRPHQQGLLVSFYGYDTREQVVEFRNQLVHVRADDRPPLPEGEFYLHELLGLRVVQDDNNVVLGVIAEILETGANDVFVIHREHLPDLLLPDIDEVVVKIDPQEREMRVRLIPGINPDV
jgi:16S rRNA processing protein RimM